MRQAELREPSFIEHGDVMNPESNDEQQIRAAIEDWAGAIRTKDADRAMSHFAPDQVQFTLAPPLQYAGANAIDKAALEAWFATFRGPIGYEIHDLKIVAGTDAAFCHFLNRFRAAAVDGGNDDIWNRVTLGFRKEHRRWLIAHSHESVPFYMDGSYKAAVDLKP